MKQDKAIKKLISATKSEGLSYGFENKVMKAIYREAEKQTKRRFALNMALVSLVSLALVAAAVYVLHHFYSLSFSLKMPQLSMAGDNKTLVLFSLYIAALVLFLLGLDLYFRRLRKKLE